MATRRRPPFRHVLETLGRQKGMLGVISRKAQARIQDPARLRRLNADLIDPEQWSSLEADVEGDADEGLPEKNAQGVKANVLFFDRRRASETPWTKRLWIYDLRTSTHFTLRTNPLRRADLDEFVTCYRPENRHDRQGTWSEEHSSGRWRACAYEELVQRDKCSLDISWLRDESLEDSENPPNPDVIATEIVEDLRAALEQFAKIQADLSARAVPRARP